MSAENILKEGLCSLNLNACPESFMAYLHLLLKWNAAYNLTAIRQLDDMVLLHILDSLAILPFISGDNIIDVGSGPGLPGIPLALSLPESRIVLLDSNGKKTRFLQEARRVLKLNNVEVVQSRAEQYHPDLQFDTVVSRAFTDLQQMVSWTKHLKTPHGRWLAMKGRYPESEINAMGLPCQVAQYTVPGVEGERCCVIIGE